MTHQLSVMMPRLFATTHQLFVTTHRLFASTFRDDASTFHDDALTFRDDATTFHDDTTMTQLYATTFCNDRSIELNRIDLSINNQSID